MKNTHYSTEQPLTAKEPLQQVEEQYFRANAAERESELLAAVVVASDYLLANLSLNDSINEVLAQLGKALKADRCLLSVYLAPDANDAFGYFEFRHEWANTGVARQIDNPALRLFQGSQYLDFVKPLLAGIPAAILTQEITNDQARSEQELTGALSQFQYPIMVDGKLWGTFGVDDCNERRIWSPIEINSLRLVASALCSVVKREQVAEARIAAEREQLQQATRNTELLAAVVSVSEFLLKSPSIAEAIDQVLAHMGKAINADRCGLGLYLPPDENDPFGYIDFQYKWVNFDNTRVVIEPENNVCGMSPFKEFIEPFLKGVATPVATQGIVKKDARYEQQLTDARSQFFYPIMVDTKLWGFFCVDDFHFSRIWSPTEIDSMRLVASALASILKKEQLVGARIAAERERESAKLAGEVAVTNERNRIARDIHDTLAQGFTGVIMQAQAAEDALQKQDVPAALHHMGRAEQIAKMSLRDARRSVFALRPSVLIGQTLAQALEAQLEHLARDSKVHTSMTTTGKPAEPSNLVATELLRIAQEATNNVIRHSDARKIKLRLEWQAAKVELTIEDDGRGFHVNQDHPGFGMISMRERADRMQAILKIESTLGQGSLVSVIVDPHMGIGPE